MPVNRDAASHRPVHVHLVDGTYELFRHYYAVPKEPNDLGLEIGATRGVITSMIGLLESGATHVGVATDHVIESFRNELWPDYKDGSGIEPELYAQFGILEDALEALGVTVWAMERYEADDALAAAARLAAADETVSQVLICTPDKDLAQCVRGKRVVQVDRRRRATIDEEGVIAKFGVPPRSIPDWLALVGDSADGYPGVPGWGAKSAATVLQRYEKLDAIPSYAASWEVAVRGAQRLADNLRTNREQALLFRHLATLAEDAPVGSNWRDWEWTGPKPGFVEMCERLVAADLPARVVALERRTVGQTDRDAHL
jgi:5'-3' exonuclease